MNNVVFLIVYLIAMTLTYLWRMAFFGGAMNGNDINSTGNAMHVLMLISYVIMIFVTYKRGKSVDKTFLVAFPIVAALFDLILVFIPFVPTIMNIITIVMAMPNKPKEISVN